MSLGTVPGGPNSPLFNWDADLTRTALHHRLRISFLHQNSAHCVVKSSIASATTPQPQTPCDRTPTYLFFRSLIDFCDRSSFIHVARVYFCFLVFVSIWDRRGISPSLSHRNTSPSPMYKNPVNITSQRFEANR